ncbi:5024_t:CDS:2 [Ambispora gerdemannii]|uniref:5024_t:CDS:1 n=1 Tax=Ambispora gerdemannii TaxID=144530 RepID=A0A9N8ZTP2_9GLOM|nr:5024_t:CDS:2 [Ambispora gerdemannii]
MLNNKSHTKIEIKQQIGEIEPPSKRTRTEKDVPLWQSSPKKQKLIGSKSILIGLDNFTEILNRGLTILDKSLLIADFLECNALVSSIVRNGSSKQQSSSLRISLPFLSIPPMWTTAVNYLKTPRLWRRDRTNSIITLQVSGHLFLKSYNGCDIWSKMQIKLFGMLTALYSYVYDKLNPYETTRSEDKKCKRMDDALVTSPST